MHQETTGTAPADGTAVSTRWNDRGASLVEYALLIALIAIVCAAAVGVMGQNLSDRIEGDARLLEQAGQ